MDTLELAEQIYRADFAPTHVPPWRTLPQGARAEYRRRAERVETTIEDRRAEIVAEGEQRCADNGHDCVEDELNASYRQYDLAIDYIELLEDVLTDYDIPFPKDPR